MQDVEVVCPYCEQKPEWVNNKEIYGKSIGKSYMIYLCRKCDASVGCHRNTKIPLGTLADRKTREARKKAHEQVDMLWQSGRYTRDEVYKLMAQWLGLKEVHIGSSDREMCKQISYIATFYANKRIE